jgi:methionyl-tRNA formyltransferase
VKGDAMARVVFLGTPSYAVPPLEALLAHHTVVAVVTQPDRWAGRGRRTLVESPVKQVAQTHGVPVYQPRRLSRDVQALAALEAAEADVFVLAAYGQILRTNVLAMPPHGVIGLHASLLPRWRGAAPVAAAIRAGDAETGVTLMLTEAGLDTGPILASRAIPIRPDDTTATLTERLAHLAAELLIERLPAWLRGEIIPTPQDDAQATYAPEIAKAEGVIDWSANATAIDRHIRAMSPWPGAFTHLHGERIAILQARPLAADAPPDAPPGTIVKAEEGLAVVTGQGLLLLEQIQPAGKRPMSPDAYVCGHPDCVGVVLA